MAIQYEKISNMLPAGALTGAELVEIVQGGVNKKATVADIVDSLSVSVVTDGTTITGDGTAESPITASGALLDEIDGKLDSVSTTDAFTGTGTAGDPLDSAFVKYNNVLTVGAGGADTPSAVEIDPTGKNVIRVTPTTGADYYDLPDGVEGQPLYIRNDSLSVNAELTSGYQINYNTSRHFIYLGGKWEPI